MTTSSVQSTYSQRPVCWRGRTVAWAVYYHGLLTTVDASYLGADEDLARERMAHELDILDEPVELRGWARTWMFTGSQFIEV